MAGLQSPHAVQGPASPNNSAYLVNFHAPRPLVFAATRWFAPRSSRGRSGCHSTCARTGRGYPAYSLERSSCIARLKRQEQKENHQGEQRNDAKVGGAGTFHVLSLGAIAEGRFKI